MKTEFEKLILLEFIPFLDIYRNILESIGTLSELLKVMVSPVHLVRTCVQSMERSLKTMANKRSSAKAEVRDVDGDSR